jgi:hypothetical protein
MKDSICLFAVILIYVQFVTGTPVQILPIEDVYVDCSYGVSYMRGLLPMPDGYRANITEDACQHVFNCIREPGKTKPKAILHNCADADPTKPYFDINTCECVGSNANCEHNKDPSKTAMCARRTTAGDEEENCMNYGPTTETPVYYIDHFPDLNDPTKFWLCQPYNTTATIARTFNCTSGNLPNVIWDQRKCLCTTVFSEGERNELINFNSHPSNRFKCAHLYPNSTWDLCKDHGGQYYTGKVASQDPDQNVYYECVQDTVNTYKSFPAEKRCPSAQVFDITSCECNPNEGFDPIENFNPENSKRCALPILPDDEDKESCRDENGLFHLGQIPHQTDCSKFWNCGESGNPTVQNCQPELVFNVFSNHCGCDYPDVTDCEKNLRPENKFLCAKNTTSHGL